MPQVESIDFKQKSRECAIIKRFKNNFYVDILMELFNGNRVCSFCNTAIDDGGSICDNCMTTYNIKSYDLHNDGCGCNK
jgi:predicted amidophosphoribosyltransferase